MISVYIFSSVLGILMFAVGVMIAKESLDSGILMLGFSVVILGFSALGIIDCWERDRQQFAEDYHEFESFKLINDIGNKTKTIVDL